MTITKILLITITWIPPPAKVMLLLQISTLYRKKQRSYQRLLRSHRQKMLLGTVSFPQGTVHSFLLKIQISSVVGQTFLTFTIIIMKNLSVALPMHGPEEGALNQKRISKV